MANDKSEILEPEIREPLPGQLPLFDVEPTLFGLMEKERKERPREKRATAAKCGTGPEGETCGTCRHRMKPDGIHQKCGLVRHLWTYGEATDIKARWAACSGWEMIPKELTVSSAQFSKCRRYRYSLVRTWDPSKPYMAVIGLNPSTADETNDDPTIRRCIDYAKRWGYGELWMLNLFAFRSTDPTALYTEADPVGPLNDETIQTIAGYAGLVLAAWGKHGSLRNRASEAVALMEGLSKPVQLKCLAVNKDGSPTHPLYQPKTASPIDFHPEQ